MNVDVTHLRAFGEDTHPDVERILVEGYRRMTPQQRLRCALELTEAARQIVELQVRADLPPGSTARELALRVAERMHGVAFVAPIRRRDAER